MKLTHFRKIVCMALVLCCLSFAALASDYPSKTIQFIVNKGPGGGSDTVTRMYAACLEKVLGCKTVVINRPGGDGVVGTNDVAKAAPDGYTLFLTAPLEIAYAIVNSPGVQFDIGSFTYIAGLNVRGSVLGVRKGAPFSTFEEMVAYAKANPRKVTIGTPGGTQIGDVQQLAKLIDAELTVINGGNGNQLFTQVAGGHIDIAFIGGQFYPKLLDEGCTIIAQTTDVREDGWPDVPTVKELGYDFGLDAGMFVTAPANTPDEIIKILGDATAKMFETGLLPDMLAKSGEKPKYRDFDELNAHLNKLFPTMLKNMRDFKASRK